VNELPLRPTYVTLVHVSYGILRRRRRIIVVAGESNISGLESVANESYINLYRRVRRGLIELRFDVPLDTKLDQQGVAVAGVLNSL